MRIAILGGTFNPPHLGHLFLAEEIRCGLGFDRIFFIPAHTPALKEVAGGTAPEDRLALCRAALEDCPYFFTDDCEIRRGGISYMIDTVEDVIRRSAPSERPGLILGDDVVGAFRRWKEAESIARLARVIVVHRRSTERVTVSFPHEYFDNKLFPLSSSEIRERLRRNLPVRFLVPEGVYAYIQENRLYQE